MQTVDSRAKKTVPQKTGHQSSKNKNLKNHRSQYFENHTKTFLQSSFKMLCQIGIRLGIRLGIPWSSLVPWHWWLQGDKNVEKHMHVLYLQTVSSITGGRRRSRETANLLSSGKLLGFNALNITLPRPQSKRKASVWCTSVYSSVRPSACLSLPSHDLCVTSSLCN